MPMRSGGLAHHRRPTAADAHDTARRLADALEQTGSLDPAASLEGWRMVGSLAHTLTGQASAIARDRQRALRELRNA